MGFGVDGAACGGETVAVEPSAAVPGNGGIQPFFAAGKCTGATKPVPNGDFPGVARYVY